MFFNYDTKTTLTSVRKKKKEFFKNRKLFSNATCCYLYE